MSEALEFFEQEFFQSVLPGCTLAHFYEEPVILYNNKYYYWIADSFFITTEPLMRETALPPWSNGGGSLLSFKYENLRGITLPTMKEWRAFYAHFNGRIQLYDLEWLAGYTAVLSSDPPAFLTRYNPKIHGCCKGVVRECLRVR